MTPDRRQLASNVIGGKPVPDVARLNQVFRYEDGRIFWKEKVAKKVSVGSEAGSRSSRYMNVGLDGQLLQVHRVVWAMCHGEWTSMQIDHVNGRKHDNRIENLRVANQSQNNANMPVRANSKTAVKGVIQRGNRFIAQTAVNGRCKYIGSFSTLEQAAAAYESASKAIFGDYARA